MLRQQGVRVSLSENMDALRALELLGVEDSRLFKNALRSTLVKRAADVRAFDELFDLYFLGLGAALRESERSMMDSLQLSPRDYQRLLEEVEGLLKQWDHNLPALARALLDGDTGRVEQLIREAVENTLAQNSDRIQMMLFTGVAARLELSRVEQGFEGFRALVLALNPEADGLEKILQYLDRRLRDLGQMVRTLINQEIQKRGTGKARQKQHGRPDHLLQKSFAYYTEDDIRRMNQAVVRLAQRFKNLLSLRRKKGRRGRFDIKHTLRKNLQYGGVPFQIQLDQRKKEKPQVIILCDISDSVLNASRFMLQFVYSVQDLYSKVRSFVFVSDVGEVTQLFENYGIHQAVDQALKGEIVDVYTHSNFGRAFEVFHKDYLSAVTGKTTFLIIGDGRNNYNRANEWVLKDIGQKAKQLVWLNPESRLTWGIGDSEMPRYMPYCDVVEECRNIHQLYKVIDHIAT
jgi:uncharacterized protein with von Willebrand factor type A (vWA) domain